MHAHTFYKTAVLPMVTLFGLLFGLAQVSFAATDNMVTSNNAPSETKIVAGDSKLHLQTFATKPIEVQFHYEDNQIIAMRLTNKGDQIYMISLFNKQHILGPGDDITIKPSKVSVIHVLVSPHKTDHFPGGTNGALKLRFTEVLTFKMPSTSKSAPAAVTPATTGTP